MPPSKQRPIMHEVPDCIWPSDHFSGISLLLPELQGLTVDLPVDIWGARQGRSKTTRHSATVLFYTEDYRFEGVWDKPNTFLGGSIVNAGECNFSLYTTTPPAVALYQTYRKRWLSRYWQENGLRIFVDMNVSPNYYAMNLIGIPKGWKAYCSRGYTDRIAFTEQELEIAYEHAGCRPIFLLYGGGRKVYEWALAHANDGVLWVPEDIDAVHGNQIALDGHRNLLEATSDQLVLEGVFNG